VTVVAMLAVPLGPEAVAVYVVVAAGFTVMEPLGSATEPMPLSMVTDVAFCADQVNVVDVPGVMLAGDALSVICGPGLLGAWLVPPHPIIPNTKIAATPVSKNTHRLFMRRPLPLGD